MRETPLSVNEQDFIAKAMRHAQRVDGRGVDELRRVRFTFGASNGEVEVSFGKTRVLAHCTCDIAAPFGGRSTEGTLKFNVELSPMASPAFEAGRPSEQAVEIARILERTLKDARVLDLESLCIVAEEKVWAVRVDVHVIDHDGNLVDATVLAALASLLHARRPYVSVVGQETKIHTLLEHDPVPLTIHHRPVSVTYALFDLSGVKHAVDPTRKEEEVCAGSLSVSINAHREICGLQKFGGVAIHPDKLLELTQAAHLRATELLEALQTALLADEKQRASGVWTREDLKKKPTPKITTTAAAAAETEVADVDEDDLAPIETSARPAHVAVESTEKGAYGALFEGKSNAWEDAPVAAKESSSKKSHKKQKTSA